MTTVSDICAEQRKLTQADLVIFQFPMYWSPVPAIMKGWLDRVLTMGYAYTSEMRYSQGMFKEKKAMLAFTTGDQESMFSANGINGDMNVTLWPLQNGILHQCGFQVLAPQIFWAPQGALPEARAAMLAGWRRRLPGLLEETPLCFQPNSFDGASGFQLRPEVQKKHEDQPFGLSVGTHLGKAIPTRSDLGPQSHL